MNLIKLKFTALPISLIKILQVLMAKLSQPRPICKQSNSKWAACQDIFSQNILLQSTQINKALQSAVQKVDNMGLRAHNYFASSKIIFKQRESCNYNDLIMKMVNEVFFRLDEKSLYDKNQIIVALKNFVTNLFQSVEQQDDDNETTQEDPIPGILDFITDRFVRAKSALRQRQPNTGRYMKDSSKIRQKKEKYRNKAKEYTTFLIDRKILESLHQYEFSNKISFCFNNSNKVD